MFKLDNKISIITGASRGIGKSIAKIFAESGSHVICVARSKDQIKTLADTINQSGGSASFYQCDISYEKAFRKLIDETVKNYNKIDILVNNAGITNDSLIMRMKSEQWDNVININLKGSFNGIKS